jgi:sterol 14-demethylase
MFPPLIMLMRMAKQDIPTTLNGKAFIIPKGDIVIASPAVASRMPSVFKNPDSYEPDRFGLERNEQATPYAYLGNTTEFIFIYLYIYLYFLMFYDVLGFGGGMHQCMGQQFGLLQVKTIVSILLRNYKFELVDKELPEPDYTAMVVGPKNHCVVKYTRISY